MISFVAAIVAMFATQSDIAPVVPDKRALQAFQFFSQFCLGTDGSRERALAVLGEGNALAKRLPVESTDALLHNSGTVGWAVRSPDGAGLMLAYGPENHCELRIQESGETVLVREFETVQAIIKPDTADIMKTEVSVENGVTRTMRAFRFKQGPFMATVALTTSNKRVGEQQHFLTFDMPNN